MKWLVFLVAAGAIRAQPAGQYRAFWADAFHNGYKTPAQVDRMVEDAVTANANAIFIQARRRGDVYFLKSTEPPAQDATLQPGFDSLAYTIEKAHERGIEVHAWFVVFPLWDNSNVPPVNPNHLWHSHGPRAQGRDMWLTQTRTGTLSRSLDPGHPGVTKYLADLLTEPLRQYRLDGIHLDYIRYPEDNRYGWNPVAVDRFNRLYARAGLPADADPEWSEFRRRQVTDLVRQVYLRAWEIDARVRVTAALITWGDGPANDAGFRVRDAYSRVFQNWPAWLREGIIDFGMPMNYFAEARFPGYLDRWLAYEQAQQNNRGVMPGLGIYLNSIPETMAQVQRVLSQPVSGIALYSYASTNLLNTAGNPITPNTEFYRTLGEYFREAAPVAPAPWRTAASTGHVLGTLTVDGGPPWLNEDVVVELWRERESTPYRITATDSTGFFGSIDVPPGEYHVRLRRAGSQLFRTAPLALAAGKTIRFDAFLREADFIAVAPRILRASHESAAPGELVWVDAAGFEAAPAVASAVPLPVALSGVQVLVDGVPAPLSRISGTRIEFMLPNLELAKWFDLRAWNIQVRYAGLESAQFEMAVVEAAPVVSGVGRMPWGFEIYATGLGRTEPAPSAGGGGSPLEPFNRVAGTVRVLLRTAAGQRELPVLFAALQPYQPYVYQVNAEAAAEIAAGEIVLIVGNRESEPFRFSNPQQ